ncbi:hypothetical protein T484DRAFT_1662157, partial [Baffinella frigidus]
MCHGGVAGPSSQAAQEYQETVEKFLQDTLGDGGSAQAQREVQIRELAQRQETLRTEEESAVKEKRYDDAENLSQQLTATSDKILHTQREVAEHSDRIARSSSEFEDLLGRGRGMLEVLAHSMEEKQASLSGSAVRSYAPLKVLKKQDTIVREALQRLGGAAQHFPRAARSDPAANLREWFATRGARAAEACVEELLRGPAEEE